MKFKVTAKTVDSIDIEFEDGSYATVPIIKEMNKEAIIALAWSFHKANGEEMPYDKVSDVPIEVSDTFLEYVEPDPILDYRSARERHYPSYGKQFGALYWARQGDDTEQKAVDAQIKLVKDTIPKGTSYKSSEIKGLLDG
tara:strand:- start:655 stop:1074 length:420 start_codon:yes stop_codon:yes gene_type:complete